MTETKKTAKDIVADIAKEDNDQAASQLKDLLRVTASAIRERQLWQKRRQKEIDELKQIQNDAVKLFDESAFDEDAYKEAQRGIFKIKHRTVAKSPEEMQRMKEEAYARYRERKAASLYSE